MIQIGGTYATFQTSGGHTFAKNHDRNGRCITILFKSIGVTGRFGSPEIVLAPLFIPEHRGLSRYTSKNAHLHSFLPLTRCITKESFLQCALSELQQEFRSCSIAVAVEWATKFLRCVCVCGWAFPVHGHGARG